MIVTKEGIGEMKEGPMLGVPLSSKVKTRSSYRSEPMSSGSREGLDRRGFEVEKEAIGLEEKR